MEELWKDIPGYEGRYQVSNLGRVKSLPRVALWHHRSGTVFPRRVAGRILKPGRMPCGHLSVVLGHGKPGSPVHHLVMLAFVGPRPAGMDICHNNGDPADNRLENLRYDTRRENLLDEYRANRGSRTSFTCDQVLDIKNRLAQGEQGARIARDYGVTPSAISAIKTGRSFSWLT